jgi:hypothetical protein
MTKPVRDAQAEAEIAAAFKAVGIDDTAIERRERLRVVPDREEPPDYEHIPDGPDGPNLDPDLSAETQSMHDFPGDRPAPKSRRGNPQDQAQEQPTQSAADLGIWDAGSKPLRPPPRGWLLGNQFCRGFLSTIERHRQDRLAHPANVVAGDDAGINRGTCFQALKGARR